ncbi:MAG: imidazole glycerol phosphate synthase cyclase subunit [Candidatus Devosia symbiotica]|nr:imidazole glycerol phosphate synthase cyclase subunit [Candidatus Devosia symbiotica]
MSPKAGLILCLDVMDSRDVKGVNFVDLRDAGDPVEAIMAYDAAGADELTFLDITASHEGRNIILDVIARTAEHCFMPLTVGGVRTIEDIRKLLLVGADKVGINSAAVNDPDFIALAADKCGNQCIVVSVDAKKRLSEAIVGDNRNEWKIFTHDERKPTGLDAVEFVSRMVARSAGELLVTSMDRDDTKSGFDLKLTRASAVLAASIFHFGTFTIPQAKAYLAAHGAAVRQDRPVCAGMTSWTRSLDCHDPGRP